ncbi:D-sedoheptulose-7-phosphate isomerase [Polluticaenibacter yanchengensis]|uniref:Phosphoheptose isomerase n=1 Tax=Polluticaenibacter yanchengensis TaxID=3014562 RepID=A0ABT4UGN2_9BACT|nr:SIS domain-containing protein [Chitinophagaceae bacterium LY-5]
MNQRIKDIFRESVNTKIRVIEDEAMINRVQTVSDIIINAFNNGNKVYFCGNGGSAADAQHLAAELSGAFYNRNRAALPAEALHCNTSYLTAVANDFDFDTIYVRLVQSITNAGDVLIGMSTSGNSRNVLRAFEEARRKNVITVGMTGMEGGQLKALSDYLFNVPSNDTPRIQEAHMLIGHTICQLVEEGIFGIVKP